MAAAASSVAAIDVGTNTTKLLVARLRDGRLWPVASGTVMTALGAGMSVSGRIRAEGLRLAEETVAQMVAEARGLGAERVVVACTAAARAATNADRLLAGLERAAGVAPRVLSGAEEAALTFRGLVAAGAVGPLLAIDPGGGSTEVMFGRGGELEWATSLPVGTRGLTERHAPLDPPQIDLVAAMVADARELLDPIAAEVRGDGLVSTGGSARAVRTLAGTDALDRAAILAVVELLASASAADLAAAHDLEPGRVRLCLAGVAILEAARQAFDVPRVLVSDAGLKEGLALEALE